jgi:hypothetical protein
VTARVADVLEVSEDDQVDLQEGLEIMSCNSPTKMN